MSSSVPTAKTAVIGNDEYAGAVTVRHLFKYIDMKYARLPGTGKARVEVWAK